MSSTRAAIPPHTNAKLESGPEPEGPQQSGVRSPSVRELLEEFPHLRILSDKLLEEFSHFGEKLLEEFPHPEGRLQWSVELLEEFTHPEHRKVKNSSRSLRTLNSLPEELTIERPTERTPF